jgi:MFS transporter, MHS family, shikimate and dehydroshikimate transport protein
MRAVAAASAVGTTIEWYDFLIYSTAASLVLNRLTRYGVLPKE